MTNTRADYVKAFAALTVPLLRARAAAAGIAGRSKMNKTELIFALADFEVDREEAHAAPAQQPQQAAFAPGHGYIGGQGLPQQAFEAYLNAGTDSAAPSAPRVDDLGRHVHVTSSGHYISLPTPSPAVSDVPAELCDHGIKRGRKCSICTEDAAKTPKLTPAQQRALENVFADSIGDVRVDVAFCEPRVRVALEQLGLVRRSRWDLTEEGLRLIQQMGVTPRTNIYDRSDLSWLGDGAYTDARQS